jgi:hypothetical protein
MFSKQNKQQPKQTELPHQILQETPQNNPQTTKYIPKSAYNIINAYINSQKHTEIHKRALSCILGAYMGDNLGNYNEFS